MPKWYTQFCLEYSGVRVLAVLCFLLTCHRLSHVFDKLFLNKSTQLCLKFLYGVCLSFEAEQSPNCHGRSHLSPVVRTFVSTASASAAGKCPGASHTSACHRSSQKGCARRSSKKSELPTFFLGGGHGWKKKPLGRGPPFIWDSPVSRTQDPVFSIGRLSPAQRRGGL